jgi:hypothetical protein
VKVSLDVIKGKNSARRVYGDDRTEGGSIY